MGKFIKKSVVIEAIQFTGGNSAELHEFVGSAIKEPVGENCMVIETLEGDMKVSLNDYVIKGVKGEFYPCKPDIFDMSYMSEDEVENISDGYHTFKELYRYRLLYNAAFFNALAKEGKIKVCKSRKHNDGEDCFGGGHFIVMAILPTGQISNHYEDKDWDLFNVPELDKAWLWDGHTADEAANRLCAYLRDIKETTFMDRLVTERDELSTKLSALCDFVDSNKFIEIVKDERQRDLLLRQRECMSEYLNVLLMRIEALNN